MAIVFNPLTGLFDISGAGAAPVISKYPDLASFPSAVSEGNGALALALDTNILYESNGTLWLAIAGPGAALSVGSFNNTSTANGLDISSNVLSLHAADAINPGAVSTGSQTFSGDKTFNDKLGVGAVPSTYKATINGTLKLGNGSDLSINGAYGLFSSQFQNSGVTLNKDNPNTYCSIDFIENANTGMGWSIQTQPLNDNLQFNNRLTSQNLITLDTTSKVGILKVPTTTLDVDGDITANSTFYGNAVDTTLAGTLALGTGNATVINIGNSGATVNISGTVIYEETTQLQVKDPLITLNKNGAVGSASNSGIELEENGVITGYAETSADRNSWILKAPNTAGEATITPGISGITLDQSSHDPLTLASVGSSPNGDGASLLNQVLTLQPADNVNPGVVTAANQTFAGQKTFENVAVNNTSETTNVTIGIYSPATYQDYSLWNELPSIYVNSDMVDANTAKDGLFVGSTDLTVSSSANKISGYVYIGSGSNYGNTSHDTGNVYLYSGRGSQASDKTGDLAIFSGDTIYGISGDIDVYTGISSTDSTGSINLTTGNTTNGDTGDIVLSTGTSSLGIRGNIELNANIIRAYNPVNIHYTTLSFTNTGTITINTPVVTSYSLTLPSSQGSTNSTMINDGSGNLSWVQIISSGDIPETSFNAAASQTNASVNGFAFANATVRSFKALVSVTTPTLYEVFDIIGVQKGASWVISSTSAGDSSGYTFNINNSGQMLYTSGLETATIKFRASTTSV